MRQRRSRALKYRTTYIDVTVSLSPSPTGGISDRSPSDCQAAFAATLQGRYVAESILFPRTLGR